MTDQIITKDEAIDRMKAGLPCESNLAGGPWIKTEWSDFANRLLKFRKPPEPRRVARVWNDVTSIHMVCGSISYMETPIHVREVLPGDVVLQRELFDRVHYVLSCAALTQIRNGERTFYDINAIAKGLIEEGS